MCLLKNLNKQIIHPSCFGHVIFKISITYRESIINSQMSVFYV